MNALPTPHGSLALPAFLPDATRGVVKTLTAQDLVSCGIEAVMVNALHLSASPGISLIESQGGIHAFMGWTGPVASDSGGFQAYSMLSGKGSSTARATAEQLAGISDEGISVRRPGRDRNVLLTPEISIRQQLRLGTDILFCLDQCTHPQAPASVQQESVRRTVAWARRCMREFTAALAENAAIGSNGPDGPAPRPMLFAVVQGGDDPSLRRACAQELAALGFDGYGFGGWPVDSAGALAEMAVRVVEWLPVSAPKHGLGIGKPDTLVAAWRAGYRLFDCVIPTRDARHGRLYAFHDDPTGVDLERADFHAEIAISTERYAREKRPLDPGCPCPLCRNHSAAYLHHLFKIEDPSGPRLATLHNLTFYARLLAALRSRG